MMMEFIDRELSSIYVSISSRYEEDIFSASGDENSHAFVGKSVSSCARVTANELLGNIRIVSIKGIHKDLKYFIFLHQQSCSAVLWTDYKKKD